jgi:uncharacterized protein YdeI (YjbR/CyaY-like superfamily)
VDDESYTQRFTPRRPRSIWSTINITRVEQLTAEGRMAPAGLKAFEARTARRSGVYSFEQRAVSLDETLERRFRSEREAWRFFAQQPPGYQRVATWFVMSAVKPETRLRRLEKLIDDSAHRRRLGLLGGKAPASTAARSRRPATTCVKRRSRP